jgi:hypothetical protein
VYYLYGLTPWSDFCSTLDFLEGEEVLTPLSEISMLPWGTATDDFPGLPFLVGLILDLLGLLFLIGLAIFS